MIYIWTMHTVCKPIQKHFVEPQNAPEGENERNKTVQPSEESQRTAKVTFSKRKRHPTNDNGDHDTDWPGSFGPEVARGR